MERLVILGVAGNSLEILDAVLDAQDQGREPRYEVVGFLDDNHDVWDSVVRGYPVLGGLSSTSDERFNDVFFVNGIGSPSSYGKKPEIIGSLGIPDNRFATVIHPTAVVSRSATVGVGTVILQNAVVCSGVRVGRHVHVLPLTVVSHDSQVEDFATLSGGVSISGHVHLGQACYVGTGACIRGGVRIGAGALVGMGAVVLNDVTDNMVVAGVPAAELRTSAGPKGPTDR